METASIESSVFNLELAFLLPIPGFSVIQGYLCITIGWVFFRKKKFVETIAILRSNFIELSYTNLTLGTNSNYFTSFFSVNSLHFYHFPAKAKIYHRKKSELVSTTVMMQLEDNLIQQTPLLYSNSHHYYVFYLFRMFSL